LAGLSKGSAVFPQFTAREWGLGYAAHWSDGLRRRSAAWLYGLSALPIGSVYLAVIVLACAAGGFSLHVVALVTLRRLCE